jgi:DNA-binding MarR family transcriptional regulator
MIRDGQPDSGLHPLARINQTIHAPARLMILTYLYVIESADYVFLMRLTGLTWGNLATHLNKLEGAGYVEIQKTYNGKKPLSILRITPQGRSAFQDYKKTMKQVLDDIPE